MPVFRSRVDPGSEEFARNRREMLALVAQVRRWEARAQERSAARADRFHARGQLLPRERVQRLLDPGAPWLELGNLAGFLHDTDDRDSSVPGGAQVAGVGVVAGTRCLVLANDSGIGAGAISASGGAKVLRAQRLALENRLPLVLLVESAGANLLEYRVEQWVAGGAWFGNLALLSAAGVPVLTVLHGSSTAGGAYLPGMSDVVIGVRGRGRAFLAGPPLLRAATGEVAQEEELGGVDMHASVSGLVEHVADDDADALRLAREVVRRTAWGHGWMPPPRTGPPPLLDPDELAGVVPVDYRQPYDCREVVARLVDGSDLLEFAPRYGPATVCVEAELSGHPVGLLANNGPIDVDGATKATHFVQRCSQTGVPLVFLQNITGYMVGTAAERAGMVKHGSGMIQAVRTARVPRFTVQVGASYGAGNYGMCGQAYEPRFLFTWPNARSGVMGPEQAARTMRIVAEARAQRSGEPVEAAAMDAFSRRIVDLYSAQEPAEVTSGRGLDDGVIDPRDTRRVLSVLLAVAAESAAAPDTAMTFPVMRP